MSDNVNLDPIEEEVRERRGLMFWLLILALFLIFGLIIFFILNSLGVISDEAISALPTLTPTLTPTVESSGEDTPVDNPTLTSTPEDSEEESSEEEENNEDPGSSEPECACDGPDLVCDDGTFIENEAACAAACSCEGPNLFCDDGTAFSNHPTCPVFVPPPPPDVCGDGVCNVSTENSDLCPADCGCVDNGTADPGEGCNCRDVVCEGEDQDSACGSPCSGSCGGGLSCVSGICWDAAICEPPPPPPGDPVDPPPACTCQDVGDGIYDCSGTDPYGVPVNGIYYCDACVYGESQCLG